MLAKIRSAGVLGVEAFFVDVEVDVGLGLPAYTLVGLPDSAVKEGAVRVKAALEHCGISIPPRKITINLAPADVRKDGAAFDLPIAIALLAASGFIEPVKFENIICIGELGLDGEIKRVLGTLPIALFAKRQGAQGIVVPSSCAEEALAVSGIHIHPIHHLKELFHYLHTNKTLPVLDHQTILGLQKTKEQPRISSLNLHDVRGNEYPKRALEIAAAGGHNILFMGPPGTGKSMLARRFPSILPPLLEEEALETSAIYSSAGLLHQTRLLHERPFRAPHHDISVAGLIGGGTIPRPGEISLAHHGVLFLDELPEFKRPSLEALRQPLEDRKITIVRSRCALTYPSSFSLVAAMNPCPCGYLGSHIKSCVCDSGKITQYRSKISGPLLDRFDLHVEVPHIDYSLLLSTERTGDSSQTIQERVVNARSIQQKRYSHLTNIFHNASLPTDRLLNIAAPDKKGELLLMAYAQRHLLSHRAVHRILKIARTIADLAQTPNVQSQHVAEALTLRMLDRGSALYP